MIFLNIEKYFYLTFAFDTQSTDFTEKKQN